MKMRNKYFVIVLILVSTLFIYNCSEVKDDIAQPEELEGIHPDGFGTLGADNFHSFKIQAKGWDMTGCQKCHAVNYTGGTTGVSCLDCHQDANGPESCNTCHGDFSNDSRIAPPTDLDNNYLTSAKGVGAHTAHVYESTMFLGAGCYDCHPGNSSDDDYIVSHSDGLPAEMIISGYSFENYSCSDTYCHGNFEFGDIKGNNFSPVWNIVDGTQAACGTCHGTTNNQGEIISPTPEGHPGNFQAENCISCHPSTFNEDGSRNKFIHINGKANIN